MQRGGGKRRRRRRRREREDASLKREGEEEVGAASRTAGEERPGRVVSAAIRCVFCGLIRERRGGGRERGACAFVIGGCERRCGVCVCVGGGGNNAKKKKVS